MVMFSRARLTGDADSGRLIDWEGNGLREWDQAGDAGTSAFDARTRSSPSQVDGEDPESLPLAALLAQAPLGRIVQVVVLHDLADALLEGAALAQVHVV